MNDVYREHTTGYGHEVLRKLILCSLHCHGLSHIEHPKVLPRVRDIVLGESTLDCVIVEECLLLSYSALFNSNQYAINRGKSFLKSLGLQLGIAANFGKTVAEIALLQRR